MAWSDELIDSLTIPSGAVVPGDTAWVLGTVLPAELVGTGAEASLIGYNGDYNTADATPQVKYFYITVTSGGSQAFSVGYVLDMNPTVPTSAKRLVTSLVIDSEASASNTVRLGPQVNATINDLIEFGYHAQLRQQQLEFADWPGSDSNTFRPWRALTLANGWTTNTVDPFLIKRTISGEVHLRGVLFPGTLTNSTICATMPNPARYAPHAVHVFGARTGSTNGDTGLAVNPAGQIYLYQGAAPVAASYIWANFSWLAKDIDP